MPENNEYLPSEIAVRLEDFTNDLEEFMMHDSHSANLTQVSHNVRQIELAIRMLENASRALKKVDETGISN